jgi:hypothetical protein
MPTDTITEYEFDWYELEPDCECEEPLEDVDDEAPAIPCTCILSGDRYDAGDCAWHGNRRDVPVETVSEYDGPCPF